MYFKKKCHSLGRGVINIGRSATNMCFKKIFCNFKSDKSSYCILNATEKVKLEVDAQAALQIYTM